MKNTEKILAAFLVLLIVMLIFVYMLKHFDNLGKFEVNSNTKVGELVQIANPASAFCLEQGGELNIRDGAGGQVGYCVFPNGKECEEWAHFRLEC